MLKINMAVANSICQNRLCKLNRQNLLIKRRRTKIKRRTSLTENIREVSTAKETKKN